jgi:hypothetical protein
MSCSCSSYGSYIGNINCPTIPIPNLGLPCVPPFTPGTVDASGVTYTGPNLSCSGILSGDTLQTALSKIDAQICSSLGNIGSYNTACLAPITTWQQFVESISNLACTTDSDFATFVSTTFPNYQTSITNQFTAITQPGISGCTFTGILVGDSLTTVLTKLNTTICSIVNTNLSLSGVNWSQCFAVGSTPVTIAQGFNAVINQICQLNTLIQTSGSGGTLPTFNTVGSCLPSPSAADTLVSVVNKLIIRTCQAPTFDINALTWGCVAKPSVITTDLQGAFGAVLSQLNTLTQNAYTFSSDFVITNAGGDPCLGKVVSLATPLDQDRFVAATPSDVSPGTLQDKLVAGAGIGLDYFTSLGQVIINSTATASDHKVAASSTDVSPDYLINKVEGDTLYGITVTPVYDAIAAKVKFSLSIDLGALMTALLNTLTPGETVTTQFCTAVAACPSPCAAPSNVTVTYSSLGTTTTTTTSTTTTTTTT